MIKLKKGDKVAIVAPSAQIEDFAKIADGIAYLQSLGLEPIYAESLYARHRYMAGTDKQRAADINTAIADKNVKALFCVRAAAGATRILPYIDYKSAKENPKPVIGFCDNAALQVALWQKSGVISLNGFSLTYDFREKELNSLIKSSFEKIIKGENFSYDSGKPLIKGEAVGRLICCNLSVLMRLAGTEYFPDLSEKILVLEDTRERLHKIDLMLQQLKQQPHFNKVKAVIFGQFTDCVGDEEDGTLADCFADFLADLNVPVLYDFNFGHTPARLMLPVGEIVSLKVGTKCVLTDKIE